MRGGAAPAASSASPFPKQARGSRSRAPNTFQFSSGRRDLGHAEKAGADDVVVSEAVPETGRALFSSVLQSHALWASIPSSTVTTSAATPGEDPPTLAPTRCVEGGRRGGRKWGGRPLRGLFSSNDQCPPPGCSHLWTVVGIACGQNVGHPSPPTSCLGLEDLWRQALSETRGNKWPSRGVGQVATAEDKVTAAVVGPWPTQGTSQPEANTAPLLMSRLALIPGKDLLRHYKSLLFCTWANRNVSWQTEAKRGCMTPAI